MPDIMQTIAKRCKIHKEAISLTCEDCKRDFIYVLWKLWNPDFEQKSVNDYE